MAGELYRVVKLVRRRVVSGAMIECVSRQYGDGLVFLRNVRHIDRTYTGCIACQMIKKYEKERRPLAGPL